MMNLGELHRLLRVTYRRMNSATEAASSCRPWNFDASLGGIARLYPVLTGSIKTRSVSSNSDHSLSTNRYGGGSAEPSSARRTRRGPSSPRCIQTEEEPGPPLKEKVTGRSDAETSCRV